jgi:hypothetical protein
VIRSFDAILEGELMVSKDVLKEKIEQQVAEWKPTIDALQEKIEGDARRDDRLDAV